MSSVWKLWSAWRVSGHGNQLAHPAAARGIALAVQNEVDGLCRLGTDKCVIQIGPRTQGQIRKPIQGIPCGLCMDGGERSAMPGVHRLQQVIAALIADLAHDDAVGTMAQSGGQELARSDGNLARNRLNSLPANGIGMRHLQLCRLLDDDETLLLGNMVKQRLHQGRLPRAGSTADNAVLAFVDEADYFVANGLGQAASGDQLIGGVPAVEFADGQRRPIDRGWSTHDRHARAVRQACIQDRILCREVLPKDARYALDRRLQTVIGIRRCQRDMLDDAITIRIDSGGAINHQVGDGRVEEQRPQLLGKEREYEVVAHRAAPVAGVAGSAGNAALVPGADGIDGEPVLVELRDGQSKRIDRLELREDAWPGR